MFEGEPNVQTPNGHGKDDRNGRLRALDIAVSAGSRRRALRIMDALIKALEKRGFILRVTDNVEAKTFVTVKGVELPMRLEERYRRVELPPRPRDLAMEIRYGWKRSPDYEFEATGQLALRIDVSAWEVPAIRRTWRDGKRQRLEDLLNKFVVGLVRAAEVKKRRDQERAEEAARRQEKLRKERERRERALLEQARRDHLTRQASSWAEHRRLQEFVTAMRTIAERRDLLDPGSELTMWIDWAEAYVEDTDPMRELEALPYRPKDVGRCDRLG